MGIWLSFYGKLYRHLDKLPYTPGVGMLFAALPARLQAHFFEIANGTLPDKESIPPPKTS
jgi:hypothetical protein